MRAGVIAAAVLLAGCSASVEQRLEDGVRTHLAAESAGGADARFRAVATSPTGDGLHAICGEIELPAGSDVWRRFVAVGDTGNGDAEVAFVRTEAAGDRAFGELYWERYCSA